MNKFHTYFGQVVTDTELNEILAELTGGIERFVQDFGYFGIAAGAVVTRHEPANMTVDVSGPAIVYDQLAQRLSFGSTQIVNCAQDENGTSTAVVGEANARMVSIFAKFVATPTDPRTSDLGETVFYRDVAGFQLRVAQGSEAVASAESPRAALRGDQVLLADVRLVYGQTSIQAEDISLTRTQTAYALPGTPIAIKARSLTDVLQAMLDSLNTVRDGVDLDFDALQVTVNNALAAMVASFASQFTDVDTRLDASETADSRTAYKDVINTFIRGQVVNSVSYETPMLATVEEPGPDGWRLQLRFPNGDDTLTRIYSGVNNESGLFMIVANARWSAGNWIPDLLATPSLAAIWNHDEVRIVRRAPGASGFNTSAIGNSVLRVGQMNAENIYCDDTIYPGVVSCTGDVKSGIDFRYSVTRSRTSPVPISFATGCVTGPGGSVGTGGVLDDKYIGVRFPGNATLNSLKIAHLQAGGLDNTFRLFTRGRDWALLTGGGFSALTAVSTLISGTAGDGMQVTTMPLTHAIDPLLEYILVWTPGHTSAFFDALRMEWSDPGPRND